MKDNFTLAEHKKKYKDEEVYIVPRYELVDIKDKFTKSNKINSNFFNGTFIKRYEAENEPALQQIIPYIIIKHEKENSYYISQRIGGEERLKNKLSIGFGGHINPCDCRGDFIQNCITRELSEELIINKYSKPKFIGYIRDIESSTNDHTGLVYTIKTKDAEIKENDSLIGKWMSPKELKENYFKFEGWAKYLIDVILENKI